MPVDHPASRNQQARSQLAEVVGHLKQFQSTLAVAVAALRQQNADLDADVARLLQRTVGDKLQEQIDKLEAVLRLLPRVPTRKR